MSYASIALLALDAYDATTAVIAGVIVTGQIVEMIRKYCRQADNATSGRLLREHVESASAHGVGCSEHTCGNPLLLRYVLERCAALNIPGPALAAYRTAMDEAIGTDVETGAAEAEEFARWNESRPALTTMHLEGFRMEATSAAQAPAPAPAPADGAAGVLEALWVRAPLVGLLAAWRWRRRAR